MSIFSQVPATRISRSRHNLSHQVKTSFDAGKINPIMCELARPGDTWKVGLEQFVRTMPMIAPLMDSMDIKVDSFFIPIRLIWDDFEDYITLGPTGQFSAVRPTISYSSTPSSEQITTLLGFLGTGGLADMLNFPFLGTPVAGSQFQSGSLDALPFRAYQFVYNEYFLNEVLDDPIPILHTSGNTDLKVSSTSENAVSHFMLKNRGWNKDYFTSALPTPQKGPAVKIPYGDIEITASKDPQGNRSEFRLATYAEPEVVPGVHPVGGMFVEEPNGTSVAFLEDGNDQTSPTLKYESGLAGQLDSDTLPTIEELRYAEVLQEFYEANARGGTRPKEYYQNIWHTKTRDARLDRPEYLGGYRGPITITDIDQNSESAVTPQGTLAGKGVSAGGNRLFRYHVPEWGIILVTMSVVPKSSYYQGFRKWNLYNDVFDWPNPFFANLGEQEILNKEIYHNANDGLDDDTFGYTPRYAECKFIPSSVHGQFRTTLDYWHLARKFGSRPNLNSAFLHVQPAEVERAFPLQVSDSNKFLGTFFFHVDCKMYLPYWGVPRLIHSL